ncbi:MerR family transcriptional regulator [Promicromonospora sp. NPDC050880]|uniref:MerR family transcriptional regulator n=1 Tax=Promicromonospora sp. NPDC050880 TaxID=3364406 RepID=UPI003794F717
MTPRTTAGGRLRTADVARESGYSPQQVRDLERLGVIPPAVREANGYRAYTGRHVRALRAYRGLASAAGPVDARRLLAEVADLAGAAAAVGAVHVRLAQERDEVLRARAALDAIEGELPAHGEVHDADVMTITQLAAALGVRTSTLRFWEQEGLAVPQRVTSLRARQYGPAAVREARVVAALRAGGYGIPAVRDVVASLRGHAGIAETRQILDHRLDRIATRTIALLRAGADIAAVIEAG